jgi:catechol 2,3-dioxygenase-like lactoylglutathione lyase family enzyme
MISGIHHINLVVPPGTLAHATTFYATTLGFTPGLVPHLQRDTLICSNATHSEPQARK